jgi:hypothetical protein
MSIKKDIQLDGFSAVSTRTPIEIGRGEAKPKKMNKLLNVNSGIKATKLAMLHEQSESNRTTKN